jgi:hypothetical protein
MQGLPPMISGSWVMRSKWVIARHTTEGGPWGPPSVVKFASRLSSYGGSAAGYIEKFKDRTPNASCSDSLGSGSFGCSAYPCSRCDDQPRIRPPLRRPRDARPSGLLRRRPQRRKGILLVRYWLGRNQQSAQRLNLLTSIFTPVELSPWKRLLVSKCSFGRSRDDHSAMNFASSAE